MGKFFVACWFGVPVCYLQYFLLLARVPDVNILIIFVFHIFIYTTYLTVSDFLSYQDDYDDFQPGYLTRNQKDVADLEWQTMIFLFRKIWIWIITLLIFSEFLRKLKLFEVLKLYQICISVIFILIHLGPSTLVGIIVQPFLFKTVRQKTIKKSALWITNIALILFISFYKYKSSDETFKLSNGYNEKELYLHILAIYWTNLRSFSFFMELSENIHRVSNLDLFSYCLYLPVLFNGPFLFYSDFKNAHVQSFSFKNRLFDLTVNLLRFLFWLIVIEISLHFIYINATSFQVKLVQSLDGWALYGYGYLMGQYFHMKYLVVYGLSTSMAKFENISVPSLPKCIGRIHLYSDMWKYFDNGLYKFLLRYIYIPTAQFSYMYKKIISSLLCFTFVYIWHGLDYYIFIWAFLNFFGIFLENISSYVYQTYLKKSKIINYFSTSALRRITCLLASFLLAMSAISNFFFFAGVNIGTIFITKFLQGSFIGNTTLIFALYCCCQVSTELRSNSHNQTERKKA